MGGIGGYFNLSSGFGTKATLASLNEMGNVLSFSVKEMA